MRIATLLGAGLMLLLYGKPAYSQQLKLGSNPSTIQKSAVLELNSTNQGLLLARITDTTLINTLAPPDGMVIFFTPAKQLMVRSNGSWQAFTPAGSAISSLNGLTAATQTFATGTSGNDFGISSSGTVHTLNLPDASATARGLITTGTQTLAGVKTFPSAPVFSSLTAGSIPYIGTGGALSQNNAKLFWDATNGRLGVGTTAPATSLHVSGANPLTLMGVQTGTSTSADSLLTITNGLVRKIPTSTYASAANFWALGGNTVGTVKNLGTVDAFDLPFITNNTEKMRLGSSGNLGIGSPTFNATNPEKLLVQAGTTTSFNLMQGHGKINNYLQLNIQNDSAGTSASSDLVATSDNGNESSNFVDLGINSSVNTSTGVIGGANNAYLYSTGNDFSVGNATAGKNLLFFTGGTAAGNEAMRINGSGRVGVGITNPGNPLVVKDTLEIRRTGTLSQLLFSNTAGAGDFRIGGDGGDIFWQGGGGRNLQMGAYWTILLGGDRQVGTFPSYVNGSGNTGVLVQAQRDASVPLAIAPNSATQTANLTEWRSSAGAVLNTVDKNGNLGLGTSTPSTKLHVAGTNPLTLTGVQTGTSTSADSLLTITSGLVRKIPMSTFTSSGNFWGLGGNTVGTAKKIGTIDSVDIPFITNNTEQMRLSADGNLAIGASTFDGTAPEKVLIDAGPTDSYNLLVAKGNTNSYLQFNIQNQSALGQASTDIVATANNGTETTNYVDLGMNGGGYNNGGNILSGPNNGYLYSAGQDFIVGNSSTTKNLILFTGGINTSNERMRITSAGKVGINTTSPSAQLDVAGNFKLGSSGSVLTNMFKTSVTVSDNNNITYSQSLTKTVTVTGAVANASVIVTPRSALPNGVGIAYAYASAANTVTINFTNTGAGLFGNQQLGTVTFDITIIQ